MHAAPKKSGGCRKEERRPLTCRLGHMAPASEQHLHPCECPQAKQICVPWQWWTSPQLCSLAGADIIMALDDVVPTTAANPARFLEATHRTTRWIDRCIAAHSRCVDQRGEQAAC